MPSRFETIASLIPSSQRVLSKLLTLHITSIRNQAEYLSGTLFLIVLESFNLISSCVKGGLTINQKLITESYMLWFSLNTGDEEFSCQMFKYICFLSDMYFKVRQNIIIKYFIEIRHSKTYHHHDLQISPQNWTVRI